MLDIKYIRNNQNLVKQAIKNKQVKLDLDKLLLADKARLEVLQELEKKRSKINQASSQKPDQKIINKLRALKQKIKNLEPELKIINKRFQELMLLVPNIPSKDMPIGKGEKDNKILEESGGFKQDNWHKDHVELGEKLDLIDTKQSAKVSGSRFAYLKNQAVLLQDALHIMLRDELLKRGFKPVIPPVLVKERALIGTSHFPEGRDQVYKIDNKYIEDKNNLYLVGSSEPSLFAYFMDKTLPGKDLPQKLFALTSCFRTEVGSWGKDVRGIKRVHQFDKLEMDVVCSPNLSEKIFQDLIQINKWFLEKLEIPYRVVNKCTGDSGYIASHKQYDLEGWLPSQKNFIELGTCTNTTDFQARRLNIKYKNKLGKTHFCHTVNDTGCAMGRMIIAILENHQQKDGTIKIPKALQKYTNFEKIG